MKPSLPVEVQTLPAVNDFNSQYVVPGIPLLLKGVIDEYPARKWTLPLLIDKVGDNIVHIRKNTNTEEYRLGRKYNVEQIQFRKYAEMLLRDDPRAASYYLAVQNIKTEFPQLQDDFPVPPYIGRVHGGPFLWIGAKNHYEYCHVDANDGMLFQITGQKRVRLYSHKYLKNMYPHPLGSKGRTIQAAVNCDAPDLERHPLFAEVECQEVVLQPGDALFIPAFTWHQVSAFESSISVNIFWGDAGETQFLQKLIDTRYESLMYWVLNIVEQNRNLPSWEALLSRLPEVLLYFFHTQFKNNPNKEQTDRIVKSILEYLNLSALPPVPPDVQKRKYPLKLKIRGLVWRG